jgi:hypothetical protein
MAIEPIAAAADSGSSDKFSEVLTPPADKLGVVSRPTCSRRCPS